MKKVTSIIFLIALLSAQAYAQRTVTVVMGLYLPPYIMKESRSGIEYDIIKSAFSRMNLIMEPIFVPFNRVDWYIDEGHADAAAPINQSSGKSALYYSNSHIKYQNVVVTLNKNAYVVNRIEDIAKLPSVTGFQNAKVYLGEAYREAVQQSTRYIELANQKKQVESLFLEKAAGIVLDINIFKYYFNSTNQLEHKSPFIIHEVFAATPYSVAFRDKQLRDTFNKGLEVIKQDGTIQQIWNKYGIAN